MDVSNLIPQTGPIPIPWVWFELLSVLTFVLHILMMNALVGGGLVTLFSSNKAEGTNLIADSMKKKLPTLLAWTVNFGVAPLLFLQVLYGSFIYSSFVLSAYFVIAIIALVIGAYYFLYIYEFKFPKGKGFLGAAVIFLLFTGFILTNLMTQMLIPESWTAYFANANGTLLALGDPTLIPKYLHFMTATAAIGGLAVALLWNYRKSKGADNADGPVATGMNWFKYGTMVQIVIGIWFFLSLPGNIMSVFLGGNIYATVILWLGVACALIALYYSLKIKPVITAIVLLVTVLLMAISRAIMRAAYLAPHFTPASPPVTGKIDSFILFAVTLVIGLALVGYMLKMYLNSLKEA